MESVNTLLQLSGKISPGRTPGFTGAYVFKALQIINLYEPGRKQLSEKLGLGEGTTRTLIKRFLEENLIETSRQGMRLSLRGRNVLSSVSQLMAGLIFPKTSITVADYNFAVVVKNSYNKVQYGVEQRDAAIMAGAKGASTLVMEDNVVVMPGVDSNIGADSLDALKSLDLENGDVVIIGSAESLFNAEIGAYSAALELLVY